MWNKDKRTVILVTICVSALVLAGLIIWRRPIAIKYHKHRIGVLLNRKPKLDPDSGLSYFGDDSCRAFETHRDSLVELGYFQRKEFPLSTIKNPSLRFRRLWEELEARFPNNPYIEGHGYESGRPATIVVWGQLDKFPQWNKIISAHDAPPTSIVDASQREHQSLLAFIGHWVNEEGEVCYVIVKDAEGNVRIETPPDEGWRTEFRKIRLDGNKILLDEFSYTDPNEDYKSPIDMSGEHPFSGVRCQTVLEVDPKDPNQLFERGSTAGRYGILDDPNVYIFTRLK